jgi:hypothetical protein
MVATPSAQRGIGGTGIFFGLVLFAFVLTILFKLGPSYMSFWTLKSLMDDLAEAPESVQGGRLAIVNRLNDRLNINNMGGLSPKELTVNKRADESYELKVAYERRQHLFANVDVVLTFSHAVAVKGR